MLKNTMNQAPILSPEKIAEQLAGLPDWRFVNDRLVAEYVMRDFDAAMRVVNAVADVAREMDHHPLMTNVYNRVMFSLSTHEVGDKVTELDVELAKRISEMVAAHQ